MLDALDLSSPNIRPFRVALTSSPRLGRGLVTGLLAHGVRLALVLGHAGVNLLDDVRADRAGEDGGEGMGVLGRLAIGADDRDGGPGRHFFEIRRWVICGGQETSLSVELEMTKSN